MRTEVLAAKPTYYHLSPDAGAVVNAVRTMLVKRDEAITKELKVTNSSGQTEAYKQDHVEEERLHLVLQELLL